MRERQVVIEMLQGEDGVGYNPVLEPRVRQPSPYAVTCHYCSSDDSAALIYLTKDEYMAQMQHASAQWVCPDCGENADWEDKTYDDWCEVQEALADNSDQLPFVETSDTNESDNTDVNS